MYVAAVTACNDNLSKLSNTKTKSLTLIYEYFNCIGIVRISYI